MSGPYDAPPWVRGEQTAVRVELIEILPCFHKTMASLLMPLAFVSVANLVPTLIFDGVCGAIECTLCPVLTFGRLRISRGVSWRLAGEGGRVEGAL
jgi:hypothetical protein